jgi:protein Mpv17
VIGTRVALDQFILTPLMVAAFFTSQAILEGHGVEEVKHRLSSSWELTLIKNWMVFIPVQLANFSVVPPHFRLGLVNLVSLFWK